MITEFGDNLHVLFIPEIGKDWEAFASWYSVNKNLPYASTSLIYFMKEGVVPFQIFQWAKRLEIPTCGLNKKDQVLNVISALYKTMNEVNKPILFVPSLCMTLKPLPFDVLEIFKNSGELYWDKTGIGICTMSANELLNIWNRYSLTGTVSNLHETSITVEANETDEPKSLVSYKKGCGKWIHKKKGCPFASAGGLINEMMTINEQKIVELWRKMVPLYSSIS